MPATVEKCELGVERGPGWLFINNDPLKGVKLAFA